MKLTYTLTPAATPEVKERLHKNRTYIVWFFDFHNQVHVPAGATWNGKKFVYCDQRFVKPENEPIFEWEANSLKEKQHKHIIVAFAQVAEGRIE